MERPGRFPWNQKARRVAMHTVVLTIIQVQALIKLKCLSESDSSDEDYKKATSFILKEGINEYDPISFIAKVMKKIFLLTPLLSLGDESYTVYFNIQD